MQTKWYLRSFVILVVLIGLTLEQIAQPNQQIVVEFAGDSISLSNAQNTIAAVTNKLQDIGAKSIKVQQGANGVLTISYYSTIDTEAVKGMLSSNKEVLEEVASNDSYPKNQAPPFDTSSVYKLDVYEIQQQYDIKPDLNGLVLTFEGKTHRYFIAKVYGAIGGNQIAQQNKITTVSFIAQGAVSLVLTDFSYKIPQVRAGPIA
ncbi:hypothetical protein N9766_03205 [Flavobacteriaceae bacterium]|nr:hypothetical protein [Flavobacteriaceae bacterium]